MGHGPKVVLLGWGSGTWTKVSIVVVGLWNMNNM